VGARSRRKFCPFDIHLIDTLRCLPAYIHLYLSYLSIISILSRLEFSVSYWRGLLTSISPLLRVLLSANLFRAMLSRRNTPMPTRPTKQRRRYVPILLFPTSDLRPIYISAAAGPCANTIIRKIQSLPQTYAQYRTCRGDGHCGWRGTLPRRERLNISTPYFFSFCICFIFYCCSERPNRVIKTNLHR
jgi:hypothetical protein